jgi:hypothetical protein
VPRRSPLLADRRLASKHGRLSLLGREDTCCVVDLTAQSDDLRPSASSSTWHSCFACVSDIIVIIGQQVASRGVAYTARRIRGQRADLCVLMTSRTQGTHAGGRRLGRSQAGIRSSTGVRCGPLLMVLRPKKSEDPSDECSDEHDCFAVPEQHWRWSGSCSWEGRLGVEWGFSRV